MPIVQGLREGVKSLTGVGMKRGKKGGAKSAGVGVYVKKEPKAPKAKKEPKPPKAKKEPKAPRKAKKSKLPVEIIEMVEPSPLPLPVEPKAPSKAKKEPKAKKAVSSSVNDRAKIVKDIMKSMNLKMTDASKYVKEKGLYKKK
jgi:hypothetical protein